jgi:hypothetical protein
MLCENAQDLPAKKKVAAGLRRKSRALTEFRQRWTNAANLRAFRSKIKTVVT